MTLKNIKILENEKSPKNEKLKNPKVMTHWILIMGPGISSKQMWLMLSPNLLMWMIQLLKEWNPTYHVH